MNGASLHSPVALAPGGQRITTKNAGTRYFRVQDKTMSVVEAIEIDAPVSDDTLGDDIVLRAVDITKVFPGTVALDKVDFNVYRGKVNVLVGENGAGKSTLMKVLAGVERATSGSLLLDGGALEIHSPHDADKHGIGIIYQGWAKRADAMRCRQGRMIIRPIARYRRSSYPVERRIINISLFENSRIYWLINARMSVR